MPALVVLATVAPSCFPISLPEPGRSEPAILRGSFDRVVLVGPPGAPESATILDFKTGPVPDAEAERLKREQYQPQLDVYRDALGALTGLDRDAICPGLCFVDGASSAPPPLTAPR